MHREIMQAPPGMVVDHINGNRMDNRRSNLRVCTRPENLRNAGNRSGCLSQYKGVSFDRKMNQWFATIWFEGRSIALGHFHDEVDAARACDCAAVELFGEFAWLNFPQGLEARRREIAAQPQKLTDEPKRRKPTKASLRAVHGHETVETQVSWYYLCTHIAKVYAGMMIAVPRRHWRVFRDMDGGEFAGVLKQLATNIHLAKFQKHPRGPKKPPPKKQSGAKIKHVATARILAKR